MIFAIYRRLSPVHGWSLLCTAPDADTADKVAASCVTFEQSRGFSSTETRIVTYDSYEDVSVMIEE
jgi:hypothetical protein